MRTANRRRTLVWIPIIALAALVGCGSDPTEQSGTAPGGSSLPPASAGASADPTDPAPTVGTGDTSGAGACELLSVDEVSGFLGQPASLDDEQPNTAKTSCVWIGREQGLHQLQLQIYAGASYFGPTRWGGTPEPVTGVGDEAFLVKSKGLGTTAGYRKGEQVVFLNYQILLNRDPDTAARADQLVALLKTVAERVSG